MRDDEECPAPDDPGTGAGELPVLDEADRWPVLMPEADGVQVNDFEGEDDAAGAE